MTIDERIQALTMNLELLSHDHEALREQGRDQGKRIEMLIAAAERLMTAAQKDGENIQALALIAQSHERRLTELESGS